MFWAVIGLLRASILIIRCGVDLIEECVAIPSFRQDGDALGVYE